MKNNTSRLVPYWQFFGGGLIAANLAFFFPAPIGWIITLGFFLFAPGYLALQFIARTSWSRWETLSFSLGLSILFLMLVGLIVNALGYAQIQRPLAPLTIFAALNIATLLLLATTWRKTLQLRTHSDFKILRWRHLFGGLLVLLPVAAAAGALRLNNGESNEVTLAVFVCIAIAFIVLIMRPSLQRYYPAALFLFALSILLSVSLRGWEITGHDIQREFNVFELTMQQGMWDIAQFRDPYNACLSITLLPALLANITGIQDAYIFKAVFQFIAAFAIIPAYFFVRRLHGPRDALMAGFIFLLFPTFLNDMAMLNRQEIAFLFFGLIMLLMLLSVEYRRMQVLTVLLLVGLTLSHYSSSYIMVGLMLSAWIVHFIVVRITKSKYASENINVFPIMTLPIIIFAGVFVFAWNDRITQTTRGLNSTISKTFDGINSDKKAESKASDVGYSIFGQSAPSSPQQILDRHTEGTTNNQVKLTAIEQPKLAVTPIGQALGGKDVLEATHGAIRNGIAKLLQLLIAIGCVVLWWRIKQHRHGRYDLYVLSLCGSSTLLLAALTVLPQLSVDYGVLRLFQQLLFILALPIIAALVWFGTILTKDVHRSYVAVASLLAIIFLHTSGSIPQITGGYAPQLALNNSGFYYDAYYMKASEYRAATWLTPYVKDDKATAIAFDAYGPLRFVNSVKSLTVTSPFTPSTKAYVYHYKSPDKFIININSNLYYYKVERNTAQESTLYSNGDNQIGKLTEKQDE